MHRLTRLAQTTADDGHDCLRQVALRLSQNEKKPPFDLILMEYDKVF